MLRIHFVQHWFNLAGLACEEALYYSASPRSSVGIDLGREPVSDSTIISKFCKLLNDKLGKELFAKVGKELRGHRRQKVARLWTDRHLRRRQLQAHRKLRPGTARHCCQQQGIGLWSGVVQILTPILDHAV